MRLNTPAYTSIHLHTRAENIFDVEGSVCRELVALRQTLPAQSMTIHGILSLAGFAGASGLPHPWVYAALAGLGIVRSATQGGALLCPGLRDDGPLGLRAGRLEAMGKVAEVAKSYLRLHAKKYFVDFEMARVLAFALGAGDSY